MLTSERIKQLSQADIAKDSEKVKERVRTLWSSLDKKARQEILDLAGVTRFTVERTYKNGNISAKLVAAMAQTQKVNPAYLAGESDEMHKFTAAGLNKFLAANSKRFAEEQAKLKTTLKESVISEEQSEEPAYRKMTRKKREKTEPKPKNAGRKKNVLSDNKLHSSKHFDTSDLPDISVMDIVTSLANMLNDSPDNSENRSLNKISDDELVSLLNGLLLRAKYNNEKEVILNLIKYILTY